MVGGDKVTKDKWKIGTIVKMEYLGYGEREEGGGLKHFHHLHWCSSIAIQNISQSDFVTEHR